MTAPNPSTALAGVIVDELVRCGVTDAVLAPGSRSAALALALHGEPAIRLHVEVDERSAGFLALGLAKATGRPAPLVTTSGTAVANLHPAVVEADAARVPLLVLSADRPPELRHSGANQTIDQVKLFGDRVRWFVDVGTAEDRPGAVAYWRSTISRAVGETRGLRGPAGPVHVNVGFREPTVPASDDGRAAAPPFAQPLDGRPDGRPWTRIHPAPRRLPDAEVGAFAARLGAVERGLLLAGDTTAAPEAVLDLARVLGWPVIAEPLSGARSGGHVVAAAHHLAACEPFARAHRPDLVLRLGRTGVSRPVDALLDAQVPQALVDPDGLWLDPDRTAHELVVADPDQLCRALVRHLPQTPASTWLREWQTADAAATAAITRVLDAEPAPSEPRVARDVAASVPEGGTLVIGSSMPVRDLNAFGRPRRGLRVVGNRGASGIDGFVSTALGVALGADGPTVALTGDLSFLHDRNGLLLRTGASLDVTFVVVNNDGGGIFSFLPQAGYPASFEAVFATPHGLDLAAEARTHGLAHVAVRQAEQLPAAVADAIAAGGIRLLEVRTERAANLALHRRITAEVDTALAGR